MNFNPSSSDWSACSDAELWSGFKDREDRSAFAQIYQAHSHRLFNYGMSIIGRRFVVEDAIQELFVELWNGRKKLAHTDNIGFYLVKSLRYKLIRSEKQRTSHEMKAQQYEEEKGLVEFPYEDRLINEQLSEERKKAITEVMGQLSARQREVITLLYFQKYSYEQAAEVMQMNLRSVYTLAWKALSSMRNMIAL